MSKTKFNLQLLNELSTKYAFTLIGEYDELTCQSKIKGSCSTPECEGIFEKTFLKLYQNSSSFCISCMKRLTSLKRIGTNITKYGTKTPAQNKIVQKKMKETNVLKYGNETALLNENVKQKTEQTNMERYGTKSPNQNQEVILKKEETFLKKYGVRQASQNDEVRNKIKDSYLNKTDEEKEEISKKKSETHLNKTEEEKAEIRQKIEQTNMLKYGVKHVMQNPEIAKKQSKNAYKLKEYTLPSGRILKLQGYEHYCINDLIIKENIHEEDILNERTDVPEIWYQDENKVEHIHFVDFFIKSLNKMIEVKSEWTLDKKKERVFLKQKAAKELGYDYEIRVYSEKGKLLQIIE